MKYPLPRLGLNYQASKNDFIRTSFGSGFRFPSLAERFINEPIPIQNSPVGPVNIFPNPDVKPEIGWSAEIAYRRTFKTPTFRMYADFALFWMEYTDMVEFTLDRYDAIPGVHPAGLGFKSINISQARIAGFELSCQTSGKIGKIPLQVWGGYTFSYPGDMQADTNQRNVGKFLVNMFDAFANGISPDSVAELKRTLRYRSLHNVRFDAQTEWKGIVLGVSANYNSHIQKIDFVLPLIVSGLPQFRKVHDKGSLIFDIRLGYKINDKQQFNFIINNLLNTEYAVRPARMGAPRTFSVKYTHVF
jgi:outer membrane receptor protein involved in Fe transport